MHILLIRAPLTQESSMKTCHGQSGGGMIAHKWTWANKSMALSFSGVKFTLGQTRLLSANVWLLFWCSSWDHERARCTHGKRLNGIEP